MTRFFHRHNALEAMALVATLEIVERRLFVEILTRPSVCTSLVDEATARYAALARRDA